MVEGIILAGGFSSRAKSNKMLFSISGKPLIMHTIEAMRKFVSHIYLVTGYFDKEIREIIKEDNFLTIVYNKDYEKGMFTSVLTGAKHIKEHLLLIPGDIPFVKEETYQKITLENQEIVIPTYQGKDGHPIFINKALVPVLLKEPPTSNLKEFRNKYDFQRINVDDSNILKDIDTLEDFENILKERK